VGKTKTSAYRLQYIDWLRGIGAVIMLQGHVFDSFTRKDLHAGGPWMMSQFLGGMPPAIFLFLTGVTLSFLMDSTERKGMAPLDRVSTAFRRSGYLFFLAFAFRLQMWIFGWPAPWTDLFKVDILNAMGFAIAVMSVMAFFRTVERVRLCAGLGLAIAFASPLVSQIDWSGVHWTIRNYIVPDYNHFGFFPWAAFLAFGMSAGSMVRAIPPDAIERAMQWVALIGAALVIAAHYFGNMGMSVYANSDFWLNSPAQVLTKQGVIFLMLALAFVWTRYGAHDRWSWVRQFGTTSLLVYWVHIELVYGRWFWFLKSNLDVVQTVIAAVVVILLMLAISTAKTYRHRIGARVTAALAEMGWSFGPRPDRVPGD
jgi:uncharacterized membrane protein